VTWKDGRKIIEARRERVAQLRLRGLSMREIIAAMESQGMVNPETGKPFGLGTLSQDYSELDKQWRANAERATSEHKAEQVAELDEVIRAAWAAKKLETVLHALERKAKVLGIDAPIKATVTAQVRETHELTDNAVAAILSILAGAGAIPASTEKSGDPETQ
jgi:hypothetical protein